MFVRVPLERMRDNPFQTRADYGDLEALAASLLKMRFSCPETSGLLQVPPGRLVIEASPGPSGSAGARTFPNPAEYGDALACLAAEPRACVELAAGHRRLRAFWQLLTAGHQDYDTFPVALGPLSDQAMADVAWEENAKRKDLSPIEQAEALQRAITSFSWTQSEVGRRWGLSQSAVANKLRLLSLPQEVQVAIRAGQLSERHGRALLAATARSARIYQALASLILPRAVDEAAAGRARQLVQQATYSPQEATARAVCAACGGPALAEGAVGRTAYRTTPKRSAAYLCLACYRAATDWTPPSATETDRLLQETVSRLSSPLGQAPFPLDLDLEDAAHVDLLAPCCTACPARQAGEDGPGDCLDPQCYAARRKLWEAHLWDELLERLYRRYGDFVGEFHPGDDSQGYDLRASDQVDRALVEAGRCGPHCPRLRFHRLPSSDDALQPFADLPFAYQCADARRHSACQRRFLASQAGPGRRGAAKTKTSPQRQHSGASNPRVHGGQAAQALLARARLSVGRALLAGHPGVWAALAQRLGGPSEASLEEALAHVAGRVLSDDLEGQSQGADERTLDSFTQEIQRRLAELGLALLAEEKREEER